jgi:hypothetical protein
MGSKLISSLNQKYDFLIELQQIFVFHIHFNGCWLGTFKKLIDFNKSDSSAQNSIFGWDFLRNYMGLTGQTAYKNNEGVLIHARAA